MTFRVGDLVEDNEGDKAEVVETDNEGDVRVRWDCTGRETPGWLPKSLFSNLSERVRDMNPTTPKIEITEEAAALLAEIRLLVEQIGNAEAAGLADPEDDDVRLAALVDRFDDIVLSWIGL